MQINDWSIHDADKNIYKAYIGTEVETRQLYVNGTRAIRARSTGGLASGTYNIDSYSNGNPAHTTTDLSMASWGNIQDVEFVYKNIFTVSRLGIDQVNVANDRLNIYMKKPGSYYVTHKGGTSAVLPSYIENAYELLDSEGEWYLNRSTGYLYYKPTAGEDMSTANVVVPVVDELLKLQGSSVNNPIHHIQFRDIKFEYTGWLRPNGVNGHSDTQNNHIREWGLSPDYNDLLPDAAITLEYARLILFERNDFSKMGITGIKVVKGSQNNLIRGNQFHDISGNAISVGDPSWRGEENKNNINPDNLGYLLYNNDILNNVIHDIAQEYQSGTAISAAYPIEMDISNNEIYNVPYSAIHFGYGWGEVHPVTQSNRIQNNYIDTFMHDMTDGGAIYAIGATNGTTTHPNVISGNFIRNQGEPKYGALYFDMGSSNWVVEDNVMENTPIWAHVNIANSANENISINNSYITGGDLLFRPELNQPNIQISEPQVYPDANWPLEARQLIANAGLESGYAHLRQDFYDLSEVQFSSEDSNVESGYTVQLYVEGKTIRGVYADLTQAQIVYGSSDTQVATVDENGLVSALSFGVTEITAEVTSNGITKVAKTFIYVDDELALIELNAPYSKLKVGESQQLTAVGVTAIGGTVPIVSLTYTSNSSAVTIDESGSMTGVGAGIAEISVSGTYAGISKTAIFEIEIIDAPSGDVALDYPYWYVSGSGTKTITPDSIKLITPSGYAVYQNKFSNEILDFNMNIDTTDSDWPSITLRSPTDTIRPVNAGNSGYVISFRKSVLEVQRFNNGVRTVIYGNIAGSPSLGGDAILNTMVQFRETHHIQVGAINEGEHVRIKLIVDGITVVNYLDTASNALTEPGYFGVIVGAGSMTLSNSEALNIMAVALTGDDWADVGDTYTLTYGLIGATDVSAQDVTLSYDSQVFDLIDAVSLESNTVIASTYSSTPGTVRYILATTGSGNALNGDVPVLNLTFQAKVASTDSIFVINQAVLADGNGNEQQNVLVQKSVTVVEKIDRAALQAAVQAAQSLYDSAIEGYANGQYVLGAKAALNTALIEVQVVLDDTDATNAELDQVVVQLNQAMVSFESMVITANTGDVTGSDGRITIADLGYVAYHFGESSAGNDWAAIKIADIDSSGAIDIFDLTFVARRIIGN